MSKQQWTNNVRSSKSYWRGNWPKRRVKKSFLKAQSEKRQVHFATLMDICRHKYAELEPKYQKFTGWVVLSGDIVKNDSASYAVFIEQGSSASQMTVVKVIDVIARLPDCEGQAADAVSAYIQVKMEKKKTLQGCSKWECPDIWIRLPRNKWSKLWDNLEDPVDLLERNLYGHPLAGFLWERQFEKVLLGLIGWEKVLNLKCLFSHRKEKLFLSIYVDRFKKTRRKQKMSPLR